MSIVFKDFKVQTDDEGKRLDVVLRRLCPELPLSAIYRLLRHSLIRLNGKKAQPNLRLHTGDTISLKADIPIKSINRIKGHHPKALWLKKILVFESPAILAFNKPRGLTAHGPGSLTELLWQSDLVKINTSLSFRPGPIHRLDRNTSGLIIFGRNIDGARQATALFKQHAVLKIYLGLVAGYLKDEAYWEDLISRDFKRRISFKASPQTNPPDSRLAQTKVIPLAHSQGQSCVLFCPLTGRTHQLRLQACLHGYPLLGDPKYNPKGHQSKSSYLLHCYTLAPLKKLAVFPPLKAPLDREDEIRLSLLFGKEILSLIEKKVNELYSSAILFT